MHLLGHIGDIRRRRPAEDTLAVIRRLLEERYEIVPPRDRGRIRREHARIIFRLLPRATRETRATFERRAADQSLSIEDAGLEALRAACLLARIAIAAAVKYAGLDIETDAPVELRRWMRRVVAIPRG